MIAVAYDGYSLKKNFVHSTRWFLNLEPCSRLHEVNEDWGHLFSLVIGNKPCLIPQRNSKDTVQDRSLLSDSSCLSLDHASTYLLQMLNFRCALLPTKTFKCSLLSAKLLCRRRFHFWKRPSPEIQNWCFPFMGSLWNPPCKSQGDLLMLCYFNNGWKALNSHSGEEQTVTLFDVGVVYDGPLACNCIMIWQGRGKAILLGQLITTTHMFMVCWGMRGNPIHCIEMPISLVFCSKVHLKEFTVPC